MFYGNGINATHLLIFIQGLFPLKTKSCFFTHPFLSTFAERLLAITSKLWRLIKWMHRMDQRLNPNWTRMIMYLVSGIEVLKSSYMHISNLGLIEETLINQNVLISHDLINVHQIRSLLKSVWSFRDPQMLFLLKWDKQNHLFCMNINVYLNSAFFL